MHRYYGNSPDFEEVADIETSAGTAAAAALPAISYMTSLSENTESAFLQPRGGFSIGKRFKPGDIALLIIFFLLYSITHDEEFLILLAAFAIV